MNYTSDDIRAAETLLQADSGLVEQLKAYVTSVDLNDPIEKTERFHEQVGAIPSNIGSLLIAAACQDIIDFGNAHLCLKTELMYQEPSLTEDTAVEEAYQILDGHGAVTIERLERVKKDNQRFTRRLKAMAKADKEPENKGILNFYEEREKQKGRA